MPEIYVNSISNRYLNQKEMLKRFHAEMRWNKLYSRPGPTEFILVLDGLRPSFNIGKLIRSAQAFGAKEVFLLNIAHFNPFPAKGASRYVPLRFFDNPLEGYKILLEMGYTLVAFDVEGTQNLGTLTLPKKSALILGNEVRGVSKVLESELSTSVLWTKIKMFGKVDSLNVSVAGSIAMYEYVRQHT